MYERPAQRGRAGLGPQPPAQPKDINCIQKPRPAMGRRRLWRRAAGGQGPMI